MHKRIRSLLLCLLALGFFSCEKYEEFIKDYEFSAVYFATQKPLRTVVAYENDMSFKVGVALAGKRANLEPEWVTYQIDPALLAGTGFTLLPESYYSITNANTGEANKMVVPKGMFIGDVTLTLNREAFTADPLATQNTYALPLRLLETSADSILSGQFDAAGNELIPAKNYTILVVKYISPLHGTYYHKGVQKELNAQGGTVTETVFRDKDLSKNQTWDLSTLGLEQVKTSGVGAFSTPGLMLTRKPDNTLTVEKASGSAITLLEGAGNYQPEKREFYLNYKFTNAGKTYSVADTLVLRQAPEKDLRFEEW